MSYSKDNSYCASCGDMLDKGSIPLTLKGMEIDGMRMPWPVCKKCWTEYYKI